MAGKENQGSPLLLIAIVIFGLWALMLAESINRSYQTPIVATATPEATNTPVIIHDVIVVTATPTRDRTPPPFTPWPTRTPAAITPTLDPYLWPSQQ